MYSGVIVDMVWDFFTLEYLLIIVVIVILLILVDGREAGGFLVHRAI